MHVVTNWDEGKDGLAMCIYQLESVNPCSVDVRSSQMMIWLTSVSRADVTVPGLGRAERHPPLLLLPRPGWLFLMRKADGELSHWCLTHENETPNAHAGREKEDWERPGGWRSEKRMWGRRVAWQLSEDWVTGQGRWLSSKRLPDQRHISAYTAATALSMSSDRLQEPIHVLLRDYSPANRLNRTSLIDLHLELLYLSLRQPKFKVLIFLIQIPPTATQFDFSVW